MTTKLLYDPKRLLKLQKNEVLNEFRTKFSHKFYEVFKEAEKEIWSDNDRNFQFIQNLVSELQDELENIKDKLSNKVQAWSSVEAIETNNKIKIPTKPSPPPDNYFANISKEQDNSGISFEDFDFFDEA